MAIYTGHFRLGRDAETRTTPTGKSVTQLALATEYGYGDNRQTQWINAQWWGETGKKLANNLTKGTTLFAVLDSLHIDTYTKRDGTTGTSLVGNIQSLEFINSPTPKNHTSHTSTPKTKPAAPTGPAPVDFDDDIPF